MIIRIKVSREAREAIAVRECRSECRSECPVDGDADRVREEERETCDEHAWQNKSILQENKAALERSSESSRKHMVWVEKQDQKKKKKKRQRLFEVLKTKKRT